MSGTADRVVASTAGRLDRWAGRLGSLAGWRRYGVAALCGLCVTAAMPPLYVFPLLVPGFCGLLWLSGGVRGWRQAFALGWCFGFAHFVTGLYWITNALLVDAEKFGWLAPFAVSGLSLIIAIYTGLALAIYEAARRGGLATSIAGPLCFAMAWTAMEWVRGHFLTGFPWNLVATTWSFAPAMSQSVALFGAYGLSLLTVVAATAPAALRDSAASRGAVAARFAILVAPLALCGLGGALRLALAPIPGVDDVAGVRLRLVQANVDQSLKWAEAERVNILRKYLALSTETAESPVSHVVWPETALPFVLSSDPELLRIVAQVVPPGGLLLTGAVRVDPPQAGRQQVWNSVHAIDEVGRIVATYDKFHLVPFGEYVPLRDVLPIDKITPGASDFSAGPGPRTLTVPGLPPVSPLICYEAIFPGDVASDGGSSPQGPGSARPSWLLNVTNDAWFGHSAGPHQHFASARLRAIEEGLPLVRAANTGISAVIDPYGRVRDSLGLGRAGVLDSPLPSPLSPTPFARFGDGALFALLFAGGLAVALLQAARVWPRH